MAINRALQAEILKLNRTIALKIVVIAPVSVVLLTGFMASQAPISTLRIHRSGADLWMALARVNLQFWGLLMLPIYITADRADGRRRSCRKSVESIRVSCAAMERLYGKVVGCPHPRDCRRNRASLRELLPRPGAAAIPAGITLFAMNCA